MEEEQSVSLEGGERLKQDAARLTLATDLQGLFRLPSSSSIQPTTPVQYSPPKCSAVTGVPFWQGSSQAGRVLRAAKQELLWGRPRSAAVVCLGGQGVLGAGAALGKPSDGYRITFPGFPGSTVGQSQEAKSQRHMAVLAANNVTLTRHAHC